MCLEEPFSVILDEKNNKICVCQKNVVPLQAKPLNKYIMMHIHEEAARCLLCENAPCGANVARAIRAIRFDNASNAWRWWGEMTEEELAAAEKACIHYDKPIRIAELRTLTAKRSDSETV